MKNVQEGNLLQHINFLLPSQVFSLPHYFSNVLVIFFPSKRKFRRQTRQSNQDLQRPKVKLGRARNGSTNAKGTRENLISVLIHMTIPSLKGMRGGFKKSSRGGQDQKNKDINDKF